MAYVLHVLPCLSPRCLSPESPRHADESMPNGTPYECTGAGVLVHSVQPYAREETAGSTTCRKHDLWYTPCASGAGKLHHAMALLAFMGSVVR